MKKRKWYHYPTNLLRNEQVRKLIRWAKATSFIGFQGISLFEIILFLNNERQRDDIITRTNAIAYNFFIALFPTLIFLIAIFSTIPALQFEIFIDALGDNILPETAKDFIYQTFIDLSNIPRGGLLSAGVFFALLFASNGMSSLLDGFEKSYSDTFRIRSYWKKRLIALELTFILVLLLVFSIVLIILSSQIFPRLFDALNINQYLRYFLVLIKWLLAFSLLYGLIAFIYRYGPATRKRFGFFSPGTNLATLGSFLSSWGFSFFVNNFNTYNKIYGSIGAIIVMMIYIQINVFILLVGFELNTAIAVNRDIKKKKEETENLIK